MGCSTELCGEVWGVVRSCVGRCERVPRVCEGPHLSTPQHTSAGTPLQAHPSAHLCRHPPQHPPQPTCSASVRIRPPRTPSRNLVTASFHSPSNCMRPRRGGGISGAGAGDHLPAGGGCVCCWRRVCVCVLLEAGVCAAGGVCVCAAGGGCVCC